MPARVRSTKVLRRRSAALVAGALVASALAVPLASPAVAAGGPTTPTGFTAVAGATPWNSVALSWKASADPLGIVGQQIWRQAGGGQMTLIANAEGESTHYNATHLY